MRYKQGRYEDERLTIVAIRPKNSALFQGKLFVVVSLP